MTMQLVTALKVVTPALATLDTQAVDFLAQVTASTTYCLYQYFMHSGGSLYDVKMDCLTTPL